MHWYQTVAGALTGLVVGATGVGGGALMTPLLLLGFGVAPATAVGTDLCFATLTKLAATRIYHGRGNVDWPMVRRLWAGSLPASLATVVLLRSHGLGPGSQHLLRLAIAGAVLLTACGLLLQFARPRTGEGTAEPGRRPPLQVPLTIAAGAALGALVTATSVGAGALGVVVIARLHPRLAPARLVGTDLVHAIPLALFAGAGHLLMGGVDFGLLGRLLLGSIPGVLAGAAFSTRLPHRWLRLLLAGALLLGGCRLWVAA